MRLGDAAGPDVPGSGVSEGFAEAVPIGGRRGTAVLDDVVVPPWLRMPSLRLVTESSRTPEAGPTAGGPCVRAVSPGRSEPGSAGSPVAGARSGTAPSGGSPGRSAPVAGPSDAAGREGGPVRPVTELAARRVTVHRPAVQSARPRIVEDTGILGLSRLTRGRVGSRLFTLFFVAVFTLIALQMVLELLHG